MEIHAADRYERASDLWTITCVFNPSGYRTKIDNYCCFAEKFQDSGLPLITVECAFGDKPFSLPSSPDVIRVRSNSVLWQKERLLNIAISHLPPEAKKVVWIDGDLLFSNPNWAVETSKLLDTVAFAQPYQHWCRLPQNRTFYRDEGDTGHSYAYTSQMDPAGIAEMRHGLPGFAWAGRRDILEKFGLYDACIIGGGDHMIAHALTNTPNTACVHRIVGLRMNKPRFWQVSRLLKEAVRPRSRKFSEHYQRWAEAISCEVKTPLGSVPGHVLHLWHGSNENRRYYQRHSELRKFNYDPGTDLVKNEDGAWEWSDRRADLRQWAENYFQQRREDG